jgi:hypothetical protein
MVACMSALVDAKLAGATGSTAPDYEVAHEGDTGSICTAALLVHVRLACEALMPGHAACAAEKRTAAFSGANYACWRARREARQCTTYRAGVVGDWAAGQQAERCQVRFLEAV